MVAVQKVDSNVTGLRYQEETSIGVANVNNPWLALEPNSYDDFGGEFTTVARNPINAGRQRQKGVLVDLDATGGLQNDLTQENIQDILQGFMFADLRRKNDVGADRQPRRIGLTGEFEDYLITDINGSDTITVDSRVAVSAVVVAAGTGYAVDDIVEVTDAVGTVLARFRVSGETAGVVDTVDLVNPATITDDNDRTNEGRTEADTSAGAATTGVNTGFAGDDALTLTLTYGDGLVWQVGDIIQMTGHDDSANNGVFDVSAVTNNLITISQTLTLDGSINVAATMTTVGFEFAAGDLDMTVPSLPALPTLVVSAADWTTMGLIPGEWIFVGGDVSGASGDQFLAAANNGFMRINSITATTLEIDKSAGLLVTEASTAETVRVFFGRVLKNEADPTLQVRRTYQLERLLGTPDDALPSEIQAEYLEGWVANELTINYATADKITVDLAGIAIDVSTIDGPTPLKSGSRPTLVSGDAYNTSNDISRLKLSVLDRTLGSNPTALFAFLTEFSININNNLSPNKAISVLGAFDVTAGQFNVEGSMEAYFADVTAVSSIRNNDDITLDVAMVKGSTGAKSGTLIDVPLITLGDGRLSVEQDESITLPLDIPAGADRVFNHTLLWMFWDHLPNAADVS
jgi:hypothetical protein